MKTINYKLLLATMFILTVSCDSAVDSDGGAITNLTEFALQDINPNSTTYGSYISPSEYSDNVQIYYFPFKST